MFEDVPARPNFRGLPYTTCATWCAYTIDPQGASLCVDSARPTDASTTHLQLLVPHIDTIVDVYNRHYRCCWPRLLLDSCIANAAAGSDRRQAHTTAHSLHENEQSCSTHPSTHFVSSACAHAALYQISTYARGLYAAQEAKQPHPAAPRRVIYRNQLPPVFRCGTDGDVVHLITGTIVLRFEQEAGSASGAACELELDGELLTTSSPQQEHEKEQQRLLRCTPKILAMKLTSSCADCCQAELPPACRGTGNSSEGKQPEPNRTRAQMLLLQRVQRCPSSASTSSALSDRPSATSVTVCWEAHYSPFTWIVTLPGNTPVSSHINSRYAASSVKTASAAAAFLPTRKRRPRRCADMNPDDKAPVTCAPARRFSFTVWATQPQPLKSACDPDDLALTSAPVRHIAWSPSVTYMTQELRYGFGGELMRRQGKHRSAHLNKGTRSTVHDELYTSAMNSVRRAHTTDEPSSFVSETLPGHAVCAKDAERANTTRIKDVMARLAGEVSDEMICIGGVYTSVAVPSEVCMQPNASHLGAVFPRWTRWPLYVYTRSPQKKGKDDKDNSLVCMSSEENIPRPSSRHTADDTRVPWHGTLQAYDSLNTLATVMESCRIH